jgi:Cu(I)/Ag(I) efflux system membrane fusion protein
VLKAEEELLAALRMRPPQGTDASKDHDLGAQVSEAARSRLALLGVDATDIDRIVESGKPERLLPVRAPRGGVVTERTVVQGTYATPEMRLFQVSDLSKLWVETTVAPEDLESVSRTKTGRFVSRDGAARAVKFLLVEPRLSAATRAARVRFALDNRDGAHRPDDIGEVTVALAAEDLVLVPRDAVIDVGATRYLYVEREEGLFEPVVVETGPLVGEERAILRGIDAGTSVVARGGFLLDSESRLGAALAPTAVPSASAVPSAPAVSSGPTAPPAPAASDHGHDHDHGGHP